jgi:FMN-dependent NADH-azoreductase
MSKTMVRIHNLETNEIIDREMNAEELAQYEIDKLNAVAKAQAEADAAQAKTALLDRLGLTQEEFNTLIA